MNDKETSTVRLDGSGYIKLDLSDISMDKLVTEAILNKLTEEDKNILIKGALKYLITKPESTGYGGRKRDSPLELAFNRAVSDIAYKVAEEHLAEGTDARQQLRDVITKGYEKWLEQDKIELCQRIANQITKGLAGDNY